MKIKNKIISLVACLSFCLVALFNVVYFRDENIKTHETVMDKIDIDYMSLLDEFDEKELILKEENVKLEATQYLDADFFSELDNLSYNDEVVTNSYIDYSFDYNSTSDLIIVTVSFYENDELVSVETMQGVPFVNEEGKTDAIFNDEGEIVYLSDFADLEEFENCGLFSKLKKAVKKTVKSIAQAATTATAYALGAAAVCGVVAVTAASAIASGGVSLPVGLPAAAATLGWAMVGISTITGTTAIGSWGITAGIEKMEESANSKEENKEKESEDNNSSKAATSQNQMQKQVERGQAPKEVDRVDKKHNEYGQDHVHFKDGTSINKDGTVHDKGHGTPNLTNDVLDWLNRNGWCLNGLQN